MIRQAEFVSPEMLRYHYDRLSEGYVEARQGQATRVAALLSGEVDVVQDVPVQDVGATATRRRSCLPSLCSSWVTPDW